MDLALKSADAHDGWAPFTAIQHWGMRNMDIRSAV